MNPKISIIVPVYKVEPYLRRCIDSILNQTFKNFELILVDDGSPDNCGKICDEYANQNDYGLGQGVFKKSNVPLQHPNCMCYMTSVITKDLEDIASEINDWIHGASNSKLDKLVA